MTSIINMKDLQIKMAKPLPRTFKRLFDICFALITIFILSPFLILIYIIVKTDKGPVFYGHERIGRNGKKFKCLKFRSMATNSKELLEQILAQDPEARKVWEQSFKLKNDPRITKIGHFLRKTSLDELPQLFNILKGEMSTVGPRPVTEKEVDFYNDNKSYYLAVKPGLTGLWQVSGRSNIDYNTRIQIDKHYVQTWSFLKDMIIIIKTIKVVLFREGAY